MKDCDEILLATDEDREGEAISWHLLELLRPKIPVKRMVFHEITQQAILSSLDETREIDENLVGAQETRRIIDRLYGYEVSPILWRKIAPKLSAGRVQSIAIRMIVERELARMRFRPAQYWDLQAVFETQEKKAFPARLHSIDGKRIAGGRDFDPDTGKLTKKDAVLVDRDEATRLKEQLQSSEFTILSAEEKPFTRSPAPPFTTSTLQQEGNRKLRFDAKRTMRAAQRLYESGFITYMRTDSVALSKEAVDSTRQSIDELYGKDYLADKPRTYKNKVKNAQEAHEAVRPVGTPFRPVSDVESQLGVDEARVYDLIWKRTMACQMKDARGRRMTLRVQAKVDGKDVTFQATGNVIDFPGFLRAYVEGSDDPQAALADKETILPPVEQGQKVGVQSLESEEHVTLPPARLTEASLVKALEESGVGRPSTYASIIDTILRREYTFKKGTALVPTFIAFSVVRLMQDHLTELIDLGFTAKMEDRLDSIARGEYESLPYLQEFYFGNGRPGLRPLLDQKTSDIDPAEICSILLGQDKEGEDVFVRVGRYGPYLKQGETTAPVPLNTCPDELTIDRAKELLAAGAMAQEPIGHHPENKEPIYVKSGRFGPYVQQGDPDPDDKKKKPKMVSLLPGMAPDTLTLGQALDLLSLPRTVGQDEKGVDIVAHFGRYGAYIKRGDDTRSLGPDDSVLTIDKARSLELLAQEKKGRGFRRAAEPLKVFGDVKALDGAEVKVLKGRFGPYVTDGEYNASLPKTMDDPTALTLEDALDLLAKQREKGPPKRAKKKTSKKKTTKKATAKKTTKKATSKKKTTKKATAKKTTKKATKKASAKKKSE